MIDLQNKVVLVTGGSRGIGAAVAEMAAHLGADVALNFLRNQARAEEVARLVRSVGRRVTLFAGDMSRGSTARSFVDKTIADLGRLDVVVANAGIWTTGALDEMDEVIWDETMAVNLRGVFTIAKAALPWLQKSGGNIVAISSTAGQRGEARHSHYAASKGGLLAFVRSLAIELAPQGIRVNAVAPGWVDTELNDPVFGDAAFVEMVRLEIPLRRIATADDVAGPVLFLASDLARHITGATLNVNGGSVLL